MFKPVKWFMDACAKPLAGASGCKLAAKLVPKLPTCLVKGAGEEAVELGIDAALGAVGLESGTSFGKTEVAFFAGGAVLSCVGGDVGKKEHSTCVGNSFDGATEVLLADGNEARIDTIEVGDMVWAANPETGEAGPQEVTAIIIGEGNKDLVDVTVENGDARGILTTTANHPFWVVSAKRWLTAAALTVGMVLLTADGGSARVAGTHAYSQQHRVFNLTVEELHTYFVTAASEAVLVHNSGGNCGGLDPVAKGKEGVEKSKANARAKGHTIVGEEVTIAVDVDGEEIWVVGQFESSSPTISSMVQTWSATLAATAGVVFSVLWTRAKL